MPKASSTKDSQPNDLNILFEDTYLLVIDKPAGIVVNRSKTHTGETIQDFIEGNYVLDESVDASYQPGEFDDEFKLRSGIVHRLDKDTSGVIVVAKTKTAFVQLQKQFKSRDIKKEYRAIVIGEGLSPQFEIDAPIDRNPRSRLTMAIVQHGNPAKTDCTLLKTFKIDSQAFSYLSVFPLTGRTHQIRVHLAGLNHPVAGDPIYCSRVQFQTTAELFGRMMLHALSIEFIHPVTAELLKVHSNLPKEFVRHIGD